MPTNRSEGWSPSGEIAIAPNYDFVDNFSEGLAGVAQDGLSGFIDVKGDLAIPLKFTSVTSFKSGYAVVQAAKNGPKSVIAKTGKLLFKGNFRDLVNYGNGLFGAQLDDEKNITSGLLDENGKWIFRLRDIGLLSISNGYVAAFTMDGKIGYLNLEGKWIIPPEFDTAFAFKFGAAPAGYGQKLLSYLGMLSPFEKYELSKNSIGLINPEGNFLVNPKFNSLYIVAENLVISRTKAGYKLMNFEGEFLHDTFYKELSNYGENKLSFTKFDNGSYGLNDKGFVSEGGKLLVEPQFSVTNSFENGFATVAINVNNKDAYGLINANGNFVINPKYQFLDNYSERFARFSVKGDPKTANPRKSKWGFLG